MKEELKFEVQKINLILSKYLELGPVSIQEYTINCSLLTDKYFREDIRTSLEFKYIFDRLLEIRNKPCLYVFEIISETPTEVIINRIEEFGKKSEKIIPKLKKLIPEESKTLYVGKSEKDAWGRLITHLGFHTQVNNGLRKTSINHGLQLFFWTKDILLNLKYSVIEFDSEMKDILPLLEKKLAEKLRPIIGVHK